LWHSNEDARQWVCPVPHIGPHGYKCRRGDSEQAAQGTVPGGPVAMGDGFASRMNPASGESANGEQRLPEGSPPGSPAEPTDVQGSRSPLTEPLTCFDTDSTGRAATPLYYALAEQWEAAGRMVPGVPDLEWQWLVASGSGRRRRVPPVWVPQQQSRNVRG
jgi:hypothetical protein